MPKKEEIIEQLAHKYHVPKKEVEKAVMSQFKFAKKMMERDNLPSIRLPFFGIFKASKKKLEYIKKHTQNKTNDNNE